MVDAVINRIEKFLNLQSSAGIVLMAAAALALIASNAPGLSVRSETRLRPS